MDGGAAAGVALAPVGAESVFVSLSERFGARNGAVEASIWKGWGAIARGFPFPEQDTGGLGNLGAAEASRDTLTEPFVEEIGALSCMGDTPRGGYEFALLLEATGSQVWWHVAGETTGNDKAASPLGAWLRRENFMSAAPKGLALSGLEGSTDERVFVGRSDGGGGANDACEVLASEGSKKELRECVVETLAERLQVRAHSANAERTIGEPRCDCKSVIKRRSNRMGRAGAKLGAKGANGGSTLRRLGPAVDLDDGSMIGTAAEAANEISEFSI